MKYQRQYTRNNNAWYASSLTNKNVTVIVSLNNTEEGGTKGELTIEWVPLRNILSPKLIIHDDSWGVIPHFQDLLQNMAEVDNLDINDEAFCKILDSLGIIDVTEYERI